MNYTNLPVIPMPKSVFGEKNDGTFDYAILKPYINSAKAEFSKYIEAFIEYAEKLCDCTLTEGIGGIELLYDPSLRKGGYRIEITENGARLYACDCGGITNALSTILQLMKRERDGIKLPLVSISDYPDCEYRSLMIDLARRPHPYEVLHEYVDLCFLYKVKYLHLHFIDTQSYTLPSRAFPKLPTVGRCYTHEQIDALVRYAHDRNVELIPEFEVPGHAAAMVGAYPELFANTPDKSGAADSDPDAFRTNFKNNIICIGKPQIMDNLRILIEEIIDMFPYSRYIHIGGDEAEINEWGCCRDCKRYMAEYKIGGVKALYTHFTKLMTDLVLSLGRTPIVWEGFPKEGCEAISRDVLVVAWESLYHLSTDLVNEGFNIVNASWKPLYITPHHYWEPNDILAWNLYTWQNWWDKSEAFLNPIHLQPTDKVKGSILCVWEWDYEHEMPHIRKNLAALSERTWTVRRYATDEQFSQKLDTILPIAEKISIK